MADNLTVETILGNGGLVAKRISAYESRPQQMEMAKAVADALRDRKHLIVEAGTGLVKAMLTSFQRFFMRQVTKASLIKNPHRVRPSSPRTHQQRNRTMTTTKRFVAS